MNDPKRIAELIATEEALLPEAIKRSPLAEAYVRDKLAALRQLQAYMAADRPDLRDLLQQSRRYVYAHLRPQDRKGMQLGPPGPAYPELIAAIDAALAAPPADAVTVPGEPTEEMIDAVAGRTAKLQRELSLREVYRAMYDAARGTP